LSEPIFFLHIPKCGGSSIVEAIKHCYVTWANIAERDLFQLSAPASFQAASKLKYNLQNSYFANDFATLKLREQLLLYYMCQNAKYISGHFPFSQTAYDSFGDRYKFITILRDPVKRCVSTYFYNRYKTNKHCKIEMGIEEYLNSELGRQTGRVYVNFLGGADEKGDYGDAGAINRAKENLHKFALVGCLECLEDFERLFAARFGRNLKIRVLNQNPKPKSEREAILSEEIKEKIAEICQPDIEIYQYALDTIIC